MFISTPQAQLIAKQEALSAKNERVRDIATKQKQSLVDLTNTNQAAAAEKVKKAAQVKTAGVFALPAVDKSMEKASLTKEMKAQKTYAKLRQARINKRYNGKRIKAAKDAEEKKK